MRKTIIILSAAAAVSLAIGLYSCQNSAAESIKLSRQMKLKPNA